jgi:branched-chain amino acid transport system substrate-binding protein
MKQGYELWINQLNEQGGVLDDNSNEGLLGREAELVLYDDESDAKRSVNLYKRLIEKDEVDLLMGPYSSGISSAVAPIIEDAQVPCVNSMQSFPGPLAEKDLNYVVTSIAHAKEYLGGVIDIAASHGAERVALVYEDSPAIAAISEAHIPRIKEAGLEIVHQETFATDVNDHTPILRNAKDKDPDLVMPGGRTPDAVGLTKAARSIGMNADAYAWVVGATQPDFYDSLGATAKGMMGDLFWAPYLNLPHNDVFKKDFMEKFSDKYDSIEDVGYHAPGGYSGGLVMEQAVKNVGELDHDAIAEELYSLEMGIPLGNGKYKVNDKGIQVGNAPSTGQWQEDDDGLSLEAVWPDEFATSEPNYPHQGWN